MTDDNTWTGRPQDLAAAYARHCDSLRGALRQALITRAVLAHLPGAACRVLDVGGGTGAQAVALARAGHEVTVLDPDEAMLARARRALDHEVAEVAGRVTLLVGSGEDAAEAAGTGYDAALCHGVLMYLDDPHPVLRQLAACARPGGIVSVMAKNRDALAMRPGLERRWADALAVLGDASGGETGNLGVPSKGIDRTGVAAVLAAAGAAEEVAWYGLRVFTDHLGDTPVGADFDLILDLEWNAGARDPYRAVARLWHLIVRKDPA